MELDLRWGYEERGEEFTLLKIKLELELGIGIGIGLGLGLGLGLGFFELVFVCGRREGVI